MRVSLLYFAAFREAAGRSEETRELPEGTRVAELWQGLARELPLLGRLPSMPPAAVNQKQVGGETLLRDGDEVAFLPPVAGG